MLSDLLIHWPGCQLYVLTVSRLLQRYPVATLTQGRSLFPLECFEDKESSSILEDGFQRYKQSKGADFDKPQRLATRTPSGGELVKVLKRGENHNADKLSDWVVGEHDP